MMKHFIWNTNPISFLVNFHWFCHNESGLYPIWINLAPSKSRTSPRYGLDITPTKYQKVWTEYTAVNYRSSPQSNSKSHQVFKEWAILMLCAMHALFPLILRFSFTKYQSQKFNFELWISKKMVCLDWILNKWFKPGLTLCPHFFIS